MTTRLLAGAALALAVAACGTETAPSPMAKVFKGDGSTQCANNGTSVEDMSKELSDAGVDVLCGQKGADGYGYCAACGCGTGQINVYTIHAENVPDAEARGFAPVSDLPDYQDQPCT